MSEEKTYLEEYAADMAELEDVLDASELGMRTMTVSIPSDQKTRLIIRAKYDKVSIHDFLRECIAAYTDLDDDFYQWWERRREDVSSIKMKWQKRMRQLREDGQGNHENFADSDEEIETIFDHIMKGFQI